MVIDEADVEGVSVFKAKDDAPAVIDANGIKTAQFPAERLEPIRRRHAQKQHGSGRMDEPEAKKARSWTSAGIFGRGSRRNRRSVSLSPKLMIMSAKDGTVLTFCQFFRARERAGGREASGGLCRLSEALTLRERRENGRAADAPMHGDACGCAPAFLRCGDERRRRGTTQETPCASMGTGTQKKKPGASEKRHNLSRAGAFSCLRSDGKVVKCAKTKIAFLFLR